MIQSFISSMISSVLEDIKTIGYFWVIFGLFAQFLFFLRFFIQWISSEKAKKVVIPLAFWYLSIGGNLLILVYAIHRRDPVFILAGILSQFIYTRNLILFYRDKKNITNNSV